MSANSEVFRAECVWIAPRSRYAWDEPRLRVGQKRECAADVFYKGAQRAASTIIGAVCGAAEEGFFCAAATRSGGASAHRRAGRMSFQGTARR